MVIQNQLKVLFGILILTLSVFIFGCEKNSTENEITDDDYIKNVIAGGYDNGSDNEDNLMSKEIQDLNDGGAVLDNENGPLTPYDSLLRWGRIITNANVNVNITNEGDSLKNALVTRTLTGNFRIIGYIGGILDSTEKPYTQVITRKLVFKRINNSTNPRLNWRLYKISMLDGQSTQPQVGTSKVQINKVEIYLNGILSYTFNGPDFNQISFTTRMFGGTGIPFMNRSTPVQIKIYTTSQNSSIDYVAWHWARNTFGFHRIPFTLESQTGSGPYERVYSRNFNMYNNHPVGIFNCYISASSHESLYDNNINEFASDLIGFPYRVIQ